MQFTSSLVAEGWVHVCWATAAVVHARRLAALRLQCEPAVLPNHQGFFLDADVRSKQLLKGCAWNADASAPAATHM